MRILLLSIFLCTTAIAEEPFIYRMSMPKRDRDTLRKAMGLPQKTGVDSPQFKAYHSYYRDRRMYALQERRAASSLRPPAVKRLSIPASIGPATPSFSGSALQSGWVRQPPIPTFTVRASVIW